MANPFEWYGKYINWLWNNTGGKIVNGIKNTWEGLTGQSATAAQERANQQNIELQKDVNAQNQYNLEHAHQIEVADLQAAGLNPWLSVGGGAQQANLQSTQVQSTDNSKMLQTTTAAALYAIIKLASKI